MSMGNPLVASPIYNNNGNLAFQYNRVKAIHLGWSGDISNEWTYRAKLSLIVHGELLLSQSPKS